MNNEHARREVEIASRLEKVKDNEIRQKVRELLIGGSYLQGRSEENRVDLLRLHVPPFLF